MLQRIIILDVILIAILAVGGNRIYRNWIDFESSHRPELVKAVAEPSAPTGLPAAPAAGSPTAEWTDISSRNLFSFDRSDVTLAAIEEPKVQVGPKPVLFGTMAIGTDRVAMLASTQGPNRGARPMHIGDIIDGWKVMEIADKSVLVAANETRETIIVDDPTAKIQREQRRTAAAPAAAGPVSVGARTAPPAANAPAANRNGNANQTPAQGNAPGKVIRTPFGTIIDNE